MITALILLVLELPPQEPECSRGPGDDARILDIRGVLLYSHSVGLVGQKGSG